jgi:hypothetical protein
VKIDKNPDSHLLRSCSANHIEPTHEEEHQLNCLDSLSVDLKELFSIYASYGDPTNTTYLKSAKLQKMVKDAGLL